MKPNLLYRVYFGPTLTPILSQMIPNIPIVILQGTF